MTPHPDFILGVDAGLCGALALYNVKRPENSEVASMPLVDGALDSSALADIVFTLHRSNIHAAVENVHSRPRQAGAFNFGLSTGIVHGILAANGIPMTLVAPSKWKPAMGLQRSPDEPAEATKDRARALASKLFPNLARQFKRKKDDGRAEALLLAVYYHHTLTGGIK
jgi:crossover junction endodeoxyribonuclease RuvC